MDGSIAEQSEFQYIHSSRGIKKLYYIIKRKVQSNSVELSSEWLDTFGRRVD